MADGYIGIVDATIGKRQDHSVTGTGADAIHRLRVETYSGDLNALQLDTVGTVTYIGTAAPGSSLAASVWQIKKMTDTGTALSIQWADGNTEFDNVWNDRESLSYI